MESHLRRARKAKDLTLQEVRELLMEKGIDRSQVSISLLERGLSWPSREVVDALVEIFDGALTEMNILYPFRDMDV